CRPPPVLLDVDVHPRQPLALVADAHPDPQRALERRQEVGGNFELGHPSMIMPASTGMTWPVMASESSDARKTAVPVISSGSSVRRNAEAIVSIPSICSGTCFFVASVMVIPGAIAFTLIPNCPSAAAMKCVNAFRPALDTE